MSSDLYGLGYDAGVEAERERILTTIREKREKYWALETNCLQGDCFDKEIRAVDAIFKALEGRSKA